MKFLERAQAMRVHESREIAPGDHFRRGTPNDLASEVKIVQGCGHLRLRSSTRRILPLMVFGSSSTNSISRGYLYGAVTCLQWFCNSQRKSSLPTKSFLRMTKAFTIMPRAESALPM